MALIEYDIQVGKNKKTKVTYRIVQVDKGDRIRYKSNNAETAIKYVKGSPFKGPGTPQAGKPFPVGKTTTTAFEVAKTVKEQSPIHFDCGSLNGYSGKGPWKTPGKAPGKAPGLQPGGEQFVSWNAGQDVPPGGRNG